MMDAGLMRQRCALDMPGGACGVAQNTVPDKWIERNAAEVIGPERARQLYPLRSIVRTGARIAAGSDWFVSSPNPFLAIQVGMTRQDPDPDAPVGAPWIPAERVSRQV